VTREELLSSTAAPRARVAAQASKSKTKNTADAPKRAARKLHPRPPPPRAKMRKVSNDSDDDSGDGEPPAQRYGREPIRFLSKTDVTTLCNVSYPTIWKWMQQGVFPKGKEIGGKTCWRSDEIAHWQNTRPDARVKAGATS
jgi:predicted DNA-binding transcriptional regulator AlpA